MIKIRKIEKTDTEEVKGLIKSIMQGEFSVENNAYAYGDLDDLVEHYSGDRDVFLVAEQDGKIVGTVAVKEGDDGSALLRRVLVHKDYRGKGYGDELIAEAMKFCLDHGYKTVCFRGTGRMRSALQLCLKHGFEEEDRFEADDMDMVLLSKQLDGE